MKLNSQELDFFNVKDSHIILIRHDCICGNCYKLLNTKIICTKNKIVLFVFSREAVMLFFVVR